MKRIYPALAVSIIVSILPIQALAYLPEEAPPPVAPKPRPKPAVATPKPAVQKKASPPKPKPIHRKHQPSAGEADNADWCQKKGGAFDEKGNCVKDLTQEECANLGGSLENGVCVADPVACEQKGGKINESGDCIF